MRHHVPADMRAVYVLIKCVLVEGRDIGELTIKEIADRAECNCRNLYRSPVFQHLWEAVSKVHAQEAEIRRKSGFCKSGEEKFGPQPDAVYPHEPVL